MPSSPGSITPTFTGSGALAGLLAGALSVIQYPASELEAGPHQVWLRIRHASGILPFPLTGPGTGAKISRGENSVVLNGRAEDLEWTLWWDQPSEGMFGWNLEVRNTGGDTVEFDAVYTLDAALTEPDALARNELYVSQYLDVTPLVEPGRFLLAVRQNMPGSGNPWLSVGATAPIAGWCTDALQLHSGVPGTGLDLSRDLPSERLQHEHTLLGLQTEAAAVPVGEKASLSFRVVVEQAHPKASGAADLGRVYAMWESAAWSTEPPSAEGASPVVATVFSPVEWAHGEDLADDELLGLSHAAEGTEHGPDGAIWSYWDDGRHVVAAAKDRAVLRPHGHILRAAEGYGPQDVNTASTAWMAGTFASQLTRGHACGEPKISVRRSYLGLTLAEGVRLFVRDGNRWRLLGTPSAWAIDETSATWWYRCLGRMVRIRTLLNLAELALEVDVDGEDLDLMLVVRGPGGDASPLFSDGRDRTDDVQVHQYRAGSIRHSLPLGDEGATPPPLAVPELATHDPRGQLLARLIPTFTHNALIHYQVPRGLEQFTGGAWGTRDVCQGPIGLLIAADRHDLVRDVLLTVFAGQQHNGDWPQWFDYLATHAAPGYRDSHGDIVYWPLLALGEYLEVTGDVTILEEEVRWVGDEEFKQPTSVLRHVEAAVEHLLAQRSADPRLPAYGHGDWNDALQPASSALAAEMVSTWTAELEIKSLTTLATGLKQVQPKLAERLAGIAEETEEALREMLLIDDELCGYAIVTTSGVKPLVHPRDERASLKHGSLQMIHALADELLSPEEAQEHLRIIDEELDGPTGIYLFDRPVTYHGGETHTFLRAEAASFWGREIGLMYMHAHVRWVEALLRLGLADRAWEALQKILPDALREQVPGVVPMQSNCYFSSVDALFADRYEAQDEAGRLFDLAAPFAGGWRVYSSGSGLVLRMVVEHLLGLRWTHEGVEIDPVLPTSLNGLRAKVSLGGREVHVTYEVRGEGHGVTGLTVNGERIDTESLPRRYRPGGLRVPRGAWDAAATGAPVEVTLAIGTAT